MLNKSNRVFVPRKCVSFRFVLVLAGHCFSGYLRSLAYSEISQWLAVLMSPRPGPHSLGVHSQLDLAQLHVSILESAAVQTVSVRICSASLLTWCSSTHSITNWSRPASFIAQRIAKIPDWPSPLPVAKGTQAVARGFPWWVAFHCSWSKTQTL